MAKQPEKQTHKKSQTPVFAGFGLNHLELSGPLIAAEGLEQASKTPQKLGSECIPEAKTEADNSRRAEIQAIADWIIHNLDGAELDQLLKQLQERPSKTVSST